MGSEGDPKAIRRPPNTSQGPSQHLLNQLYLSSYAPALNTAVGAATSVQEEGMDRTWEPKPPVPLVEGVHHGGGGGRGGSTSFHPAPTEDQQRTGSMPMYPTAVDPHTSSYQQQSIFNHQQLVDEMYFSSYLGGGGDAVRGEAGRGEVDDDDVGDGGAGDSAEGGARHGEHVQGGRGGDADGDGDKGASSLFDQMYELACGTPPSFPTYLSTPASQQHLEQHPQRGVNHDAGGMGSALPGLGTGDRLGSEDDRCGRCGGIGGVEGSSLQILMY